jgi:hypothetical protein
MIPAFTITVVGGLHGNENEEAREEPPHTHLEELPDMNPMGRLAIPFLASGANVAMDMADLRHYIVQSGDVIRLHQGFTFPNARRAVAPGEERVVDRSKDESASNLLRKSRVSFV